MKSAYPTWNSNHKRTILHLLGQHGSDESSSQIMSSTESEARTSTNKKRRKSYDGPHNVRFPWGSALLLFSFILLLTLCHCTQANSSTASLQTNNGVRRRIRILKQNENNYVPSSTPSSTTTFELEESKRLLRLESASPVSYLYRYRAPKANAVASSPPPEGVPSSGPPQVALRHSGYSGIIRRRKGQEQQGSSSEIISNVTPFQSSTPSSTSTTSILPNSNSVVTSEVNEKPRIVLSEYKDSDYNPYHHFIAFEETEPRKEYLSPQPSETFQPSLFQQQSALWYEILNLQIPSSSSTAAVTSPSTSTTQQTPSSPPAHLNEIVDNYTIPSMRHYKFPDFRSITTTPKPPKTDFLNPYEFFSEEDLENVADLDLYGEHSKFFVKTKPRDVSSVNNNLYSSFYYEPPSFSTKIHPLPVKSKFPHTVKDESYVHQEELVTYPMTATPTPVLGTEKVSDFSHATFPTTNAIQSSVMPVVTTSNPINLTDENEDKHEPATGESIAMLSTSKASNDAISINDKMFPSSSEKPSSEEHNLLYNPTTPSSETSDTTNIPGVAGIDYPMYDEIPTTNFNCTEQRYKGFFADIETKCQVWHYCDFADTQSSFICPNGTLFSQVLLTCDWWFNVECHHAQQLYVLNERLYRYIKHPKPSFPEDFHGPHVDLWLKKQLELGLLPKIKKRGKQKPPTVPPTTLKEKPISHDPTTTPIIPTLSSSTSDLERSSPKPKN